MPEITKETNIKRNFTTDSELDQKKETKYINVKEEQSIIIIFKKK